MNLMKKCSVCVHGKRHEIDAKIIANTGSVRELARQYSLDKDAIQRHKRHIEGPMKAAQTLKATGFRELTDAVNRLTTRLEKRLGSARRSATWFQESRDLRAWVLVRAKLAGKVSADEERPTERAGDTFAVQFIAPDGSEARIPLEAYRALPADAFRINGSERSELPRQGGNAVDEVLTQE